MLTNRLPRRLRAAALSVLTVASVGAATLGISSPASAAPRCVVQQGFNVSSGGCDNDGYWDTRLRITCRVVGSYYEYDRQTNWKSRYTSWQDWVGCGDQGRVRKTYIDLKH